MTKNQLIILKEALLEAEKDEMAFYDSLPIEDFIFSEKYQIKIQKLLNRRQKYTRNTNRFVSKRLVGVLSAILITLTLMMSISAIREPIIRFIVNIYEDFVSIFINDEENDIIPEYIEDISLPTYMIDGYVKCDFNCYKKISSTLWMNSYEEIVLLNQHTIENGLKAFIDSQNTDYVKITVDSNDSFYYALKQNEYNIIWCDDRYIYNMICPNNIELSEIEKIIKSMEVVEN